MANGNIDLPSVQQAIAQHNAGWTAADNHIWRLTEAEQLRRLGVIEPANYSSTVPSYVGGQVLAPPHYDYRDINGQNFVTAIRDQGNCGSCVAFGTLAAMEATVSYQQHHANPTIYLSEAHLFFCYVHADGATCGSGWWPEKALPHCVNPGVVDNACFPYTPHDQPCNLCADWSHRLTNIHGFTKLVSIPAIKEWLTTKGAVAACFQAYTDFFAYHSGIYRHVTGNLAGGHCIAIIGYNDGEGCWICKNSWGPNWGEHGFFRIAYGQCRIDTWDVLGLQ